MSAERGRGTSQKRVKKHGGRVVQRAGVLGARRVFDSRVPHDPRHRNAGEQRAQGSRSRYRRCPRCKKLRLYWRDANWLNMDEADFGLEDWERKKAVARGETPKPGPAKASRTGWNYLDNGVLCCHICVKRTLETLR